VSDAPKSAYELAMEKLRAQDKERGEKPGKGLTEAKKKQIAEVRRIFEAKLAEREILHRSDVVKAAGDEEKLRELEKNYQTDRRRIEAERDEKIRKLRA
jgi:hypothetical protein